MKLVNIKKCRLDANVCNNKKCGKCRWECKKSIDKGRCDKGIIWKPSNCEYNKTCDRTILRL